MTDEELKDLFKGLSESAPRNAGPEVEQRLLAAFRQQHGRRSRFRNYLGEIAASLLVAGGLYFLFGGGGAVPRNSAANPDLYRDAGFVVLPYGQSDVPLEHPVIVHVQIQASELGAMGMPLPPTRIRQRVSADLLVGQDGVARAVRLVQ